MSGMAPQDAQIPLAVRPAIFDRGDGQPIERTETAAARQLVVTNLMVSLDVRVVPEDLITVRVRGTRTDVEAVEILPGEHTAMFLRPCTHGRAQASPLDVTAQVPVGTEVLLRRITGRATVGNTLGRLQVDIHSGASVRVGRVGDVELRVTDDARADIAHVAGRTLDVEAVGGGRVCVQGGEIDRMQARASGHGNVDFGGQAQAADLTVEECGHISLLRVRGELRRTCRDDGNVAVVHPPRAA